MACDFTKLVVWWRMHSKRGNSDLVGCSAMNGVIQGAVGAHRGEPYQVWG